MKKILINTTLTVLLIISALSNACAKSDKYDAFLDRAERQAFGYFTANTRESSGLTLNTTENGSPATNAAAGFMLSAMVIGAERGWIGKEEAYSAALKTLRRYDRMENFNGFHYHYVNPGTGERMWSSEVSCIDSAIFLAGAITAGEYFKGTEVEVLADRLYRKADWGWFLNGERTLAMSWKNESGFSGRIDSFSEGILAYMLAMGSPSHPIPAESWDSFVRPVSKYKEYKLIYVSDGSLFQYLFPLAWLDLRDKHDKYADYWQNAVKAVKANKKYCSDNADKSRTYAQGFWGLSASLSPGGYKNFGAEPGRNFHNGTVAPYAVSGSIALAPEFAIEDFKKIYDKMPGVIGAYGPTDAFNIDREWASTHHISIDVGLTLIMIENYRSGLIWKYFSQNRYVKKGLEAAGFVNGRQDAVSARAACAGNPGDTVTIGRVRRAPKMADDISEWEKALKASKITLTTEEYRNVEMTIGYVKDDSDLSGIFYLGHDGKNLYIAGTVRDSNVSNSEKGDKIYKESCVEVYFDTNMDGFYFDKNAYDYQFGFAPAGPDGRPQKWAWGRIGCDPEGVSYGAEAAPGGYNVKIIIPFALTGSFEPGNTGAALFSISIHGKSKDGKQRKLTWSIDSSSRPGKIFFGSARLA